MSVYIKGMEMPTGDNHITLFLYPDGKVVVCGMLGPLVHYEAVPVPPHGDLIDRDAIKYDWDEDNQTWGYDIHSAPTIIPAEEGE